MSAFPLKFKISKKCPVLVLLAWNIKKKFFLGLSVVRLWAYFAASMTEILRRLTLFTFSTRCRRHLWWSGPFLTVDVSKKEAMSNRKFYLRDKIPIKISNIICCCAVMMSLFSKLDNVAFRQQQQSGHTSLASDPSCSCLSSTSQLSPVFPAASTNLCKKIGYFE